MICIFALNLALACVRMYIQIYVLAIQLAHSCPHSAGNIIRSINLARLSRYHVISISKSQCSVTVTISSYALIDNQHCYTP